MTRDVIVDTGPLVAFLNHRDTWHLWALEQFAAIQPPLLTCESVVSEAAFLLSRDHAGVDGLLQMVERRIVQLDFDLNEEMPHVRRLMKRYANVPMSLADASLVRMTEVATKATVITLDDDFRVYRRLGRQVIPLIAPSTRRRPQR